MAEPVVLKHRQEFVEVLANYQPSEHAKAELKKINYVPFAGIAGGGRNTLIDYLVNNYDYHFVISDTTRPPKLRNGAMEVDGVNYHFRTEEDMLRDLKDGAFLEAELIHNQQVSGTSMRELERAKASGKIPIRDIEFGGIENVYRANPDNTIIGLLPPSYEEWIRRFTEREDISEQELINRLRTAKEVLTRMLEKPYFKLVINDQIEQCATDVREIIEKGNYSADQDARCRAVAGSILRAVEKRLT